MAFDARIHTTTNKPLGVSGKPVDARSYYWSEEEGYRPYNSASEALSYLTSTLQRKGNFPIYINDGSGLKEYWFKNGTTNADLVEKTTTAPALPFEPLSSLTWDVAADPLKEYTLTTNTAITTSGTAAVSRGVLLVTNPSSYTLTINGVAQVIRSGGETAITVIYKMVGIYYSSDYTPSTSSGSGSTQLSAPTGVNFTSVTTSSLIVNWTQVTNNSGYKVYRNTSNNFGTASLVATVATGTTLYADSGLNPSTTYYYWIVAVGNGTTYTDSNPSSVANTTTSAGADTTAPTVVSATALDPYTIRVVFSEATTPTTDGWSFNGAPGGGLSILSVSEVSPTTWEFAIVEAMGFGQVITFSYNSGTGNTLDGAGNELASVSGGSVTNSIGGGGGSYDADAQAYFDVATGLTTTEKDAWNDVVTELKDGSNFEGGEVWSDAVFAMPWLGDTLDKRTRNAKAPSSVYTKSGTPTFDATGIKFNANSYIKTGITNSVIPNDNQTIFCYATNQAAGIGTGNKYAFGNYDGTGNNGIGLTYRDNSGGAYFFCGSGTGGFSDGFKDGFVIVYVNNDTKAIAYGLNAIDSTAIDTGSDINDGGVTSTAEWIIGSLMDNSAFANAGSIGLYVQVKRYLSDADRTAVQTILQTFLTAIGR